MAEDGGRSLVRLRHGTSQSQSSVLVTSTEHGTTGHVSTRDNIPATSPVTSSKSLSPQNKTRVGRGTGGSRRVPGFPQRVTSVGSVASDNVQLTSGPASGHNTVDIELDTAAGSVSKHTNLPLQLIGMIFTRDFAHFVHVTPHN